MANGMAAPEVEYAYSRAHKLCQQVGETPQLGPVLFGLWRYYVVRSQLHTAREIGDTLLRLAQRAHDPALAVSAHYALGFTWFYLGGLPAARPHLEEGIIRYTPDQRRALVFRIGQDPGVACRVFAAATLWLLGYSDQAPARLHEALALAHELSYPYSLAYARCLVAWIYQFRRDVPAVHEQAETAVALSTEQGFPFWAALGTSCRGWALAMQGQGEEGMPQIYQGIAAWRATGAEALQGVLGEGNFALVPLRQAPLHLQFDVAMEGTLLMNRDPMAVEDFMARAIVRYLDFKPYREAYFAAGEYPWW
jgi:predicted ATPase